jgi:hypothetical protein
MLTANELQTKLATALSSGDFHTFEKWFVSSSWNVHRQGDAELQHLVFAIELRLAERSSGHLDEAQFRAELAQLLPAFSVS